MFFKSKEGKEAILKLYNQKLESLNIIYSQKLLKTSFGNTNVIITGKQENPPLLLIHGTGGCAPLALETFSELTEKYQIYAVDVMAQPNKSDEKRLNMKSLEYGKWLVEVINKLKLEEVTLVGFSFGGLVALKTLELNQTSIKQVFLVAPVYIVNGNPIVNLWKMFIPLKRYLKTNNTSNIKKVMDALFTEYDNFALNFLSHTFKYCNMDFSPLPVISKRNAQGIKTPITIFAAEKDIMFPGKKMIRRAKAIFPSLKDAFLIKASKHVPNSRNTLLIQNKILNTSPKTENIQ